MSERKLIYSGLKTPDGTLLQSTHRHDYITHLDKNGNEYMLDGGLDYQRYNTHGDEELIAHYDDEPFDIIRQFAYRTGFGKPGNEDYGTFRLTFYKDMSDDYLNASIKYCKEYGQRYDLLEKELEYRKLNNIVINGD